MRSTRYRGIVVAFALLGMPLLFGLRVGVAQEQDQAPQQQDQGTAVGAPPSRAAHIHQGTCGALVGPEFVVALEEIEVPVGDPVGPAESRAASVPVATSFAVIDIPLDDLLARPHAIDVHASTAEEDLASFVACGEIAGITTSGGGIAIALRATGDSTLDGIGLLVPSARDDGTTFVSVLLPEDGADSAPASEEPPTDDEDAGA